MNARATVPRALVVVRDEALRDAVAERLAVAGWYAHELDRDELAARALRRFAPDVVIVDAVGSGPGGIVGTARALDEHIAVIVVADTPEAEQEALREGAYDSVPRPLDSLRLDVVLAHIAERAVLRDRVERLTLQCEGIAREGVLVGHDPRMIAAIALVRRLARYETPVLIAGEPGTEKEAVARTLHALGKRSGRFVAVSGGTLTAPELSRSCEEAIGGTLFIDDVTALRPDVASALTRLASAPAAPSEDDGVRIVAGCDEGVASTEPAMRDELLTELLVGPVLVLPPLRERRADVPVLARALLEDITGGDAAGAGFEILPEVDEALRAHDWPGNVAELRTVVTLATTYEGRRIGLEHLPLALRRASAAVETPLPRPLRDIEVQHLRRVLMETHGNKSRAARILGLSRWALQRRMRKHGLEHADGGDAEPGVAEPS